jgi:hypothetical protein
LQEFFDYYTNVGFCVEGDELFSIIMNNVWNISGDPLTFKALDSNYGLGSD